MQLGVIVIKFWNPLKPLALVSITKTSHLYQYAGP